MSDNNSSINNNSSSTQQQQTPLRFRSRFPKAQPNIGLNSGINRIRRLSGHYNENEKPEEVISSEKHESPQKPLLNNRRSSIKLANADLNNDTINSNQPQSQSQQQQQQQQQQKIDITNDIITKKNLIESVEKSNLNDNKIIIENDKIINTTVTLSTKCNIDDQLTLTQSTIDLLNTLQQNNYNPRFSKEHIMNIIKHKAMQKLKKIESDNLKEKRRSYKPTIDTENIDRSKLRMRDLLYYNPKTRAKKTSADNSLSLIDENSNLSSTRSLIVDNVSERLSSRTSSRVASITSTTERPKTPEPSISYNAPQLKFAEDGSIILNEESLVIQRPHVEPVFNTTVVENDHNDNLTYNSYRKFHHTKKWSNKETVKFYKALSMIGSDFTMIQRLFPHRNRDEIKRKFKREEKINQALIDKLLSKTAPMDLSVFINDDNDDDNSSEETNNQTTNENDKISINNNNNNKKPYNRNKPKRLKKRAFVESDGEDDNKTNKSKKTETTLTTTTTTTTNEISQHIIDSINTVITCYTNENSNLNKNQIDTNIIINEFNEQFDGIKKNNLLSETEIIQFNETKILDEQITDQSLINDIKQVYENKNDNTHNYEIELNNEIKETNDKNKNDDDDDDDDIEVVIDLDNDLCEIIDTTTKDNNNEININQTGDEIVILDLDSNKTIITKETKTKIPTQELESEVTSINSTSKFLSSTTSSSSNLNLNSKLIFVNSSNNNDKQFQVHMVTSTQQETTKNSNSEIIITKLLNKKK